MAKKKFVKTQKEIQRDLNTNLFRLGSNVSGGLLYRLSKNMVTKNIDDKDKKQRIEQTVTIGTIGLGSLGVISLNNDYAVDFAKGAVTVATVDFIAKTFGKNVEEMLGINLGEVPEETLPQVVVVQDENVSELEENSYSNLLPDTYKDPIQETVENILSEIDQQENEETENISGVETETDEEELLIENLN